MSSDNGLAGSSTPLDQAPHTPAVSDALDRLGIDGVIDSDVAVRLTSEPIMGKAHVGTVVDIPPSGAGQGRIAGQHEFIDSAPARAFLVLGWAAQARASVFGGAAALRAVGRQCAAVYVDGFVRDIEEIVTARVPTFARGTTPRSGRRNLSVVRDGSPVIVGGCRIADGDVIVADSTGMCVVPAAQAEDVIALAQEIEQAESRSS